MFYEHLTVKEKYEICLNLTLSLVWIQEVICIMHQSMLTLTMRYRVREEKKKKKKREIYQLDAKKKKK